MRTLILPIKQRSREGKIFPSREVYERIGNLTFTQLASLRHRGAFATVALTFSTCCQLVKHLDQGDAGIEGPDLLEAWYNVSQHLPSSLTYCSSCKRAPDASFGESGSVQGLTPI